MKILRLIKFNEAECLGISRMARKVVKRKTKMK